MSSITYPDIFSCSISSLFGVCQGDQSNQAGD